MLRKQSIKKDRILKFATGFVYFSVLCVPLMTSRPVLLHVLDCYGNKEENEGKYMHHFTSESMYKRLRNHSSDFGTTLSKFFWFLHLVRHWCTSEDGFIVLAASIEGK